MKKIFSLLIATLLAVFASACSKKESTEQQPAASEASVPAQPAAPTASESADLEKEAAKGDAALDDLDHLRLDCRVGMTVESGRILADEIDVVMAVDVVDPRPLAARAYCTARAMAGPEARAGTGRLSGP